MSRITKLSLLPVHIEQTEGFRQQKNKQHAKSSIFFKHWHLALGFLVLFSCFFPFLITHMSAVRLQNTVFAMHLLKTCQSRTGLGGVLGLGGGGGGVPRVWQQRVQKLLWLAVTQQIAWLTRGTFRVALSSGPAKVPPVECAWCLVSPGGFSDGSGP